jgi:hypothetical protein
MTVTSAESDVHVSAQSRWMSYSLFLLVLAAVLLYQTLATTDRPTVAVVWGSLALACYAAGLLCLVGGRDGPWSAVARWKFGPWTLIWYGLTFGLATVTWSQPQNSTPAQIAIASVLRALWLVAVGMTCWVVGYAIGPRRTVQRLATQGMRALGGTFTGTVRSRLTPWLLYSIGSIAQIASAATTGRFGYVGNASSAVSSATGYGQVLTTLSLFAPLGLATASLQVYRERLPGARATLALLLSAEFALGAISGQKEIYVIAVLAVFIPASGTRRRVPRALIVGSIFVFLVVVIPFNQAYRTAVRGGSGTLSTSQAISEAPGIFDQTLTFKSMVTVLPSSVTYLLQRIREIDGPSIILQRTPGQIPFRSVAQLAEAPIIDMVPRVLWPAKPILASGYEFSQQYYDLPSTLYTSSAITPLGDLYRHGGWVPVMAGMFVFGCGVRILDGVLDARMNPHAIFFVLLLFPSLVVGERDWVTLLASLPATAMACLLAVALAFRPRGSR